jgi:N-methylhydantoinase B
MAVYSAVGQCMQLALYASPDATERDRQIGPSLNAYGTGRWTYLDDFGVRRVYTLIDGAFSGSPAASDRDGLDIKSSQVNIGNQLEFADAEVLEAAYPLLFLERRATTGFHGYGRYRSGAGCQESFQAHNTDTLVGNMTGTRAWFPTGGAAGGYPGATMRYFLRRPDGEVEPVGIHQTGVALSPGDTFEMFCASGGGFGDPLDRDPKAVAKDLNENRVDVETARSIYGAVLDVEGEIDEPATERRRDEMRAERLGNAQPAAQPVSGLEVDEDAEALPLYPGVVQRGNLAVSERSGAVLAVAPGNWLDGCPVIDTHVDDRAGGTITRSHLDPATGRLLFVDVLRIQDGPSMDIAPLRWTQAGHNLPR